MERDYQSQSKILRDLCKFANVLNNSIKTALDPDTAVYTHTVGES